MTATATAPRTSTLTTVVVPARNEARHLARLVPALVASGHRVVVVDGGSLDATAAVAREAGALVVTAPGATREQAATLGSNAARATSTGPVLVLDADEEFVCALAA